MVIKVRKQEPADFIKVGFEGGQMPLQRRLPKFGFHSRTQIETQEVRLTALARLDAESIDLELLRAAGLVGHLATRAKVFKDGEIEKSNDSERTSFNQRCQGSNHCCERDCRGIILNGKGRK